MVLSLTPQEISERYRRKEPIATPTEPAPERSFLQDLAIKGTQALLSVPDLFSVRARASMPEVPSASSMILPYVEKAVGAEGLQPQSGLSGVGTSALAAAFDPTSYLGGPSNLLRSLLTGMATSGAVEGVRQLGGEGTAQMATGVSVPLAIALLSGLGKKGVGSAFGQAVRAGKSSAEALKLATPVEIQAMRAQLRKRVANALEKARQPFSPENPQDYLKAQEELKFAQALESQFEKELVNAQTLEAEVTGRVREAEQGVAATAEQAAATRDLVPVSEAAELGAMLQQQQPSTSAFGIDTQNLSNLGQKLENVPATSNAGKLVQSAARLLDKSNKAMSTQAVQTIANRLGLQGTPGKLAKDPVDMASATRQQVAIARENAYKPISKQYANWDANYGSENVLVTGNQLADLLNAAREVQILMGNVKTGLNKAVKESFGASLSALESAATDIGEAGVNVQVKDLRNIQKAIHQKTALAIPGDKVMLLNGLDDAIDGFLTAGLGEEAINELSQINRDYRDFKQKFDRNPSIRPLLNRQTKAVTSFEGVLNPDGINALVNAVGKESVRDIGLYMLQGELKNDPLSVIERLANRPEIRIAMGDAGYNNLIADLQAVSQTFDTSDIPTAYKRLVEASLQQGLSEESQAAIQASMRDIRQSVEDLPVYDSLLQIERTTQARAQAESSAKQAQTRFAEAESALKASQAELQSAQKETLRIEKDLAKAKTSVAREEGKLAAEEARFKAEQTKEFEAEMKKLAYELKVSPPVLESLQTDIDDARTPDQMKRVLAKAESRGAAVASWAADQLLDRILIDAPNEPIALLRFIQSKRDLMLPLMRSTNVAAFRKLADNFAQFEEVLRNSTVIRRVNDFLNRVPELTKAGKLGNAMRILSQTTGIRYLANLALRGTDLSRDINIILGSGSDASKASAWIRIFREGGARALVELLKDRPKGDVADETESAPDDADYERGRAISEKYPSRVFSR